MSAAQPLPTNRTSKRGKNRREVMKASFPYGCGMLSRQVRSLTHRTRHSGHRVSGKPALERSRERISQSRQRVARSREAPDANEHRDVGADLDEPTWE